MNKSGLKEVKMKLRPDAIESVKYISQESGIENLTQVVVDCIGFGKWAVDKNKEGAEIYAEYPDGTRERIELTLFGDAGRDVEITKSN